MNTNRMILKKTNNGYIATLLKRNGKVKKRLLFEKITDFFDYYDEKNEFYKKNKLDERIIYIKSNDLF